MQIACWKEVTTHNIGILTQASRFVREFPIHLTNPLVSIGWASCGTQEFRLRQPELQEPLPCILHVIKINMVHITLQMEKNNGLVLCLSRKIRLSKERRIKLTEIVPHKPQNRWLARVYFSASSISCSTSLSLGWFPTDSDGDFRWDESEYIHSKVKASFVFLFNLIRRTFFCKLFLKR